DLSDVSRIRRGRLELRIEEVNLTTVVKTAVEASRPHIEERGHDLSIEMPPRTLKIRGDVARLAQVFANLLNNAAKFHERRRRLTIKVEAGSGAAIVSVVDTGVGIPAAMLPHVVGVVTPAGRSPERL